MDDQETFNLSWQSYTNHLRSMLEEMKSESELTDVTLVSDDMKQIRAHKAILSASSPVFKTIIGSLPSNSMIYLRGIQNQELQSILEFLYLGKSSLEKARINEFLKVASDLQIIGLQQSEERQGTSESQNINVNDDIPLQDVKEEFENSAIVDEGINISNADVETCNLVCEENQNFSKGNNETITDSDSERKPNWMEGRTNKNGKPSRMLEKDGFFYRQYGLRKNKMYLQCLKKKKKSCSATAIVDIDLDLILGISYNEEHIHEPDTFVQFVKALEEDEIAKGLEDVNIRAETLYKNLQENILISEAGEKGLSYLKNLTSFSKILYRKRIQMGLLERKSKEQRKMKFY